MEQVSCISAPSNESCSTDGSMSDVHSSRDSSPEATSSTGEPEVPSLVTMMSSACFDDSCSRPASTQFCSEPLSLDGGAGSVGRLISLAAGMALSPIALQENDEKASNRVPLCPHTPLASPTCRPPMASPLATPTCRPLLASPLVTPLTGTPMRSALKTPGDRPKKRKLSVRFQDKPLMIAEAVATAEDCQELAVASNGADPTQPLLTPNTLSSKGFIVRGTFLDELPVLPTPLRRNASHRSQSVPKNMGSHIASEEEAPPITRSHARTRSHELPTACATESRSPECVAASPQCVFPPTPWY